MKMNIKMNMKGKERRGEERKYKQVLNQTSYVGFIDSIEWQCVNNKETKGKTKYFLHTCNSLVNLESLYGIWCDFESTSADITFPSAERERLILVASFNLSPVAPVFVYSNTPFVHNQRKRLMKLENKKIKHWANF